MGEVAKPDYLSLVNQGGSGFNVSELVTAIVASEIEPKRAMQTTKQEKTENAISGIGFLNSQVALTQKNFDTIAEDSFFNISSTNTSGVEIRAADESKLVPGNRTIENVTLAKKMVFELAGFANLTDNFNANLTIDFGSWAESGGTYTFTDADNTSSSSLSFTNKTVGEVVGLINDMADLEAQIVDTTGEGTSYSVIISGDDTGFDNGFRILSDGTGNAAQDARWETPSDPDAHATSNSFSQLSSNASFELDGVAVTRKKNSITDLIEGASIELKSEFSTAATVGISRSEDSVRQTVEDVIFSLNEFKTEIDRLTFIDIEGDENGPLAMDPATTTIKSNFKRLAVQPLQGYGEDSIYFSQLGIKTDSNGEYYLDAVTFEKTFSTNPEYFTALKDDNLSTNSASVAATKSQFTRIDEGTYAVTKVGDDWKFGDADLMRVDYNGGSRFTTLSHPGLVIISAAEEPADFNVYVGKSFANKIDEMMTSILDLESSLSSANDSYKNMSSDIEERLEALEQREELITSRYTAQFGDMEKSMTQFNSTKSLLENFIEAWKKQKN
ncbi:flagellar filament capping protein FliD [Rhodobacteraceae bacterium]|nr:flagellar filament capping protein FliD [Paracoccaceae bacterium]